MSTGWLDFSLELTFFNVFTVLIVSVTILLSLALLYWASCRPKVIAGVPIIRGHWWYGMANALFPIDGRTDSHFVVLMLFEQHGPLFQSTIIGTRRVLFVSDPKLARYILENIKTKGRLLVFSLIIALIVLRIHKNGLSYISGDSNTS
jgi:type IV secretory pathway VirB3-like protein